MNVLIPNFRPVIWLGVVAFYILCLLEGGEPNPDFLRAELITASLLAITAGASIYGAVTANQRQKEALSQQDEAMAMQAQAEAQRRSDVKESFGGEAKAADKRLKRGRYGLSTAREREVAQETGRSVDAAQKTQLAELERGDEGRVFSGRRQALKRGIMGEGLDAVSKARLGATRFSEELGESQRQRDIGIKQNYASLLAGLPPSGLPGMASSQAQMMMGMTSPGERASQLAMQGLTAGAMLGAFDKKTPAATPADTPIDQAATNPAAGTPTAVS